MYNDIKIKGGVYMAINATSTYNLRKNFKKYADDINKYDDTVLVTGPNNRNVVLISEDQYNSWLETNYLLGNKKNLDAITESLNQLKDNDSNVLTPEEFKAMQHG